MVKLLEPLHSTRPPRWTVQEGLAAAASSDIDSALARGDDLLMVDTAV
jgi:hypothetical protein